MPADTNPHGDIFGGWLVSQMDLAGGTAATRRAKGRCATVAITAMTFHRPVFVGDEVSCYADIIKVGKTSITVKVESWARRGIGDEHIAVTEGIFTYVAVEPSAASPRANVAQQGGNPGSKCWVRAFAGDERSRGVSKFNVAFPSYATAPSRLPKRLVDFAPSICRRKPHIPQLNVIEGSEKCALPHSCVPLCKHRCASFQKRRRKATARLGLHPARGFRGEIAR